MSIGIYEHYGVFLGFFDHATAVREGNGQVIGFHHVRKIREQFTSHCGSLGPDEHNLGFEPVFATSFGYADDLAFMVVDNFESAARIASSAAHLDSFTIAHPISRAWFNEAREASKLLTSPLDFVTGALAKPDEETVSTPKPLVVVTQVKLSGLLTLAFGLHAQLFAASLFLETAYEFIRSAKETARESQGLPPAFLVYGHDADDVVRALDEFRMSLMTPVSSEDLVITCHVDNYSVACSVLAAIRNLTLGQLMSHRLHDGSRLADFYTEPSRRTFKEWPVESQGGDDKGSCPFVFLNSFCRPSDAETVAVERKELDPSLSGNHVCSATYSTLGIMAEIADFEEMTAEVNGYAMIHSVADINPGHEVAVEQQTRETWRSVIEITEPQEMLYLPEDASRFFLPGKHDLSLQFNTAAQEKREYPPLSSFLRFLKLRLGADQCNQESGLQEIQTTLGIPIPACAKDVRNFTIQKFLQPAVSEDHQNIMAALDGVGTELYNRFNLDSPKLFNAALDQVGLSASTRTSTLRLYNEFCHSISDPLQFDNVVDLADAFECLYAMVHNDSEQLALPSHKRLSASRHRRRQFGEFLDGLRQAFILRLGRSSAKSEERYGEHKSSIASLLSAGDAAIKSALGLIRLRMHSGPAKANTEQWQKTRARLTGMIVPDLKQRPTVVYMSQADRWYTQIRIDSFHVFRPHFLSRILHETSHLHFSLMQISNDQLMSTAMRDHGVKERDAVDTDCMQQCRMLASELFCDGIVFALIFLVEEELFLRHQLNAINAVQGDGTLENVELDDEEVVVEYVDALHRLFIVTSYLGSKDNEFKEFDVKEVPENPAQHLAAFEKFLEKRSGELYIIKKQCVDFDAFKETAVCWVEETYPITRAAWNAIRTEIKKTLHVVLPDCVFQLERKRALAEKVRASIEAGIPVPLDGRLHQEEEGEVVFAILHAYTRMYFGLEQFSQDEENSDLPQSDRQIEFVSSTAAMRSLWHISTRQRRRRMASLIATKPAAGRA